MLEEKQKEKAYQEKRIYQQLPLFESDSEKLIRQLRKIDINRLTPLEALHILHKLKRMLN